MSECTLGNCLEVSNYAANTASWKTFDNYLLFINFRGSRELQPDDLARPSRNNLLVKFHISSHLCNALPTFTHHPSIAYVEKRFTPTQST